MLTTFGHSSVQFNVLLFFYSVFAKMAFRSL